MGDLRGLDAGDYLSACVAGVLAGLGAAMAWFKGSRDKIHQRIEAVEDRMARWNDLTAGHEKQLAVLQTCQSNITRELMEIKDTIRSNDSKLDKVLMVLRK